MNGIIGMTDLALETELSSEQREYLRMVKDSAGSLLKVINDVLDFSKIEAGKLHLDPIRFQLAPWIEETVRLMGIAAREKNIDMACHVSSAVPDFVVADAFRIRQILVNLLGNALKFTPGGYVTVRADVVEQGDRWIDLALAVRDSGIGIPADKQAQIFKEFAQADGSTNRHYGGTGLGLAICRQLAAMMNGRIEVQSQPQQGSTFTAVLRMQRAADEDAGPAARLRLPHPPQVVLLGRHPEVQELIADSTRDLGASPLRPAEDWKVLETLLGEPAPGPADNVLIIDREITGMDPLGLVRTLRASSRGRNVRVFLRAFVGAEKPAAWDGLIDGVLAIPTTSHELHLALEGPIEAGAEAEAARARPADRKAERKRILVVEDNAVNRVLAAKLLEGAGYEVLLAENGYQALELLEEESVDLVLMDVQMPG
ncbi:MAG: ATP-binding protein, partial [Acidobacteriota bacterium]|nr:ATP-binding protein [Acidobacteriota bacterium]